MNLPRKMAKLLETAKNAFCPANLLQNFYEKGRLNQII
jgi:hypothetical protein